MEESGFVFERKRMMKIKSKKWLIVAAIILALLIIGGAVFMLGNHFVNIRGKHLDSFCDSSGGGMNGAYYSRTIKRYDEKNALIRTEKADWYAGDPEINECLVDISIMDELERVIRKNKMNFWNRKEFTKMFVADGESYSYSFDFGDSDISFSSQIYPPRYRKKLNQLKDVIFRYMQDAKELPGSVGSKEVTE